MACIGLSYLSGAMAAQGPFEAVVEAGNIANGRDGFVLQGEAAGDRSGYSVGSAGDLNGDGVGDFFIRLLS